MQPQFAMHRGQAVGPAEPQVATCDVQVVGASESENPGHDGQAVGPAEPHIAARDVQVVGALEPEIPVHGPGN